MGTTILNSKLIAASLFSVVFLVGNTIADPIQKTIHPPVIEGNLNGSSNINGYFDLLVRVSKKNSRTNANQKFAREILIPEVEIKNGKFSISIDSDQGENSEEMNSYDVEYRRFETTNPFQPCKYASVRNEPKEKGNLLSSN